MANITNTQPHVKKHTHVMADITDLSAKLTQIEQSVTSSTVAVVDELTSTETTKALSANQGKILNDKIQNINTVLQSDDEDLNTIQEIVTKIKENKSTFDQLTADNLVGLAAKLAAKQDKNSLDADVAGAGFIKQTAVDAAIEGLKSNGKIKDELLSDKVVKYDEQGDITTKQAALNTYEEAEVPTSKAVKDAIAAAKQEATQAAATAVTPEVVKQKLGVEFKEVTVTFNGGKEATASDTFVTSTSWVVSPRYETDPTSYIYFKVDNGTLTGYADENENVVVKVLVAKLTA